MTPSDADDRSPELRRLPKRPRSAVPDRAETERLSPPDSSSTTKPQATSRPQLYFEKLPDPSGDEIQRSEEVSPDSKFRTDEPVADTPPALEEPSLYFRHAAPVRRFDPDSEQRVEPVASSYGGTSSSQELPVPPARALPDVPQENSPRKERLPVDDARVSSANQAAFRDVSGDPKPASSRPARTRPSRSSGQLPAVRASASLPVARTSTTSPVPHASSESPAGRVTREFPSAQRATRQTQTHTYSSASRSFQSRSPSTLADTPLEENLDAAQRPTPKPATGKGKAVAGMVLASAALVAYAFQIGSLESAADEAAGRMAMGGSVLYSLLPWLLVLPAVLLFGIIVWLLAGIIGLRRTVKKPRAQREDKRPKSPLNQFKEAALRQGVDNRTAYRGWRLLEAACGNDRPITVDALLAYDLELTPKEIRTVHLQLLTDLSRASDPAMRLPPAETVLDLLKAVEAAPVARPSTASGEVTIPGDPGQRKRSGS